VRVRPSMHLYLLGVSHRTAPVELRERLDFSSRDVGAAVEALTASTSAAETVVLSTCNRSELYVVTDQLAQTRADLISFLSQYHRIPADDFVGHLFAREDAEVVHHLFRVAAGLDSLVIGEPQVLGQVKDAFSVASDRRCSGPVFNRLFTSSFAVGKRVRSETALGEGAVSVSFASVQLARKIFGKLEGRRVLVIGAGEMGKLTAQHLRSQGVGEIVITSRTLARAEEIAAAVQGKAAPWDELMSALARADIVITATGSQQPIITRAHVASVMGRRRRDPLFIIDIAIPRDVEPGAGDIEQVFLYNVDDLQAIVNENMTRRSAEIRKAEDIVAEEVGRFMAWQRSRGAVPTVVALRQRFDAVRRAELQRLESKLAGLDADERARVEEVTRLIVEKLLLEPTEQLKALPDEETQIAYTDAVRRLFGLRTDDGSHEGPRHKAPGLRDGQDKDRNRP
jgi:glutamyl-tRNA reductase